MSKRVSLIWNMCQIADSLSSGKCSHAEAMHETMKQIHSDNQELGKHAFSDYCLGRPKKKRVRFSRSKGKQYCKQVKCYLEWVS